MKNDSETKMPYRPSCLRVWNWLDRHPNLGAVPIIGGVLAARCLPTGLVERILFSKRNEATRCVAEGFGDHVWEPKEDHRPRLGP